MHIETHKHILNHTQTHTSTNIKLYKAHTKGPRVSSCSFISRPGLFSTGKPKRWSPHTCKIFHFLMSVFAANPHVKTTEKVRWQCLTHTVIRKKSWLCRSTTKWVYEDRKRCGNVRSEVLLPNGLSMGSNGKPILLKTRVIWDRFFCPSEAVLSPTRSRSIHDWGSGGMT